MDSLTMILGIYDGKKWAESINFLANNFEGAQKNLSTYIDVYQNSSQHFSNNTLFVIIIAILRI